MPVDANAPCPDCGGVRPGPCEACKGAGVVRRVPTKLKLGGDHRIDEPAAENAPLRRRLRVLARPTQVTREDQDRAQEILLDELAKAGHPVEKSWWDPYAAGYRHHPPAPREVHDACRVVACEAIGLAYEWVEVPDAG